MDRLLAPLPVVADAAAEADADAAAERAALAAAAALAEGVPAPVAATACAATCAVDGVGAAAAICAFRLPTAGPPKEPLELDMGAITF